MDWYYAVDDVQTGPVSSEELGRLFQNGTIAGHTMVWHEGMEAWQHYHAVVPASVPVRPVVAHRAPVPARAGAAKGRPAAPAGPTAWRSGSQLLMKRNGRLPMRCVCCGEGVTLTGPGAGKTITFPLTSRHPVAWVLRLLLFAAAFWMVYIFNNPGWPSQTSKQGFMDHWLDITLCFLVIGSVDRKFLSTSANVALCLCPIHARRRISRLVVAWVVFGSGVALLFSVRVLGPKAILGTLASFIVIPVGLLLIQFAPLIRPSWIDSQFMKLKGVSPGFLEHLPVCPDEQTKS